jgi:hypothetical protein
MISRPAAICRRASANWPSSTTRSATVEPSRNTQPSRHLNVNRNAVGAKPASDRQRLIPIDRVTDNVEAAFVQESPD